jgi:hypothetical protein
MGGSLEDPLVLVLVARRKPEYDDEDEDEKLAFKIAARSRLSHFHRMWHRNKA